MNGVLPQSQGAPKTVFICAGSACVGLGHVVRCRTVAAAMPAAARVHVILIGPKRIAASMLVPWLPCTAVKSDAQCAEMVGSMEPDVVVFDCLSFDRGCFAQIKRRCLTVSISPIFDLLGDVDMVFSRAALPNEGFRDRRRMPVIFTGLRYVTIAEHCRPASEAVYRGHLEMDPLSVAISMGGADAPNRTLKILEAVKATRARLLIWVLLGEEYAHSYQQLVDCVSAVPRHEIILARTTDSMWRILSGCCVAILAGGITTYEAAYCGIPSIVTLDDGHKQHLIGELVRAGLCIYAGAPIGESLGAITAAINRLERDRNILLDMHRRCAGVLDKLGAQRIAEGIIAHHASTKNSLAVS